ncbi:FAD-dependent pyridine nucleotide-disulfide oxidoreductase [Pseudomonas putida S11]|nr:FAD-dependent pyridine nucleotide-disulfide oxidoreductase [Pseudomonas putida S11]
MFKAPSTARTMASAIPRGVRWIKARVQGFDPLGQLVLLEGGRAISYEQLVVCPGLKLDWAAIDGLSETLGRNGVTSNYRYDLAPYTWELVQKLKQGRALFCQPPMPIKCAGAPQKALYLSCDHWLRHGHLGAVKASFFNAGAVLFGVADYVPALMKYIDKYAVDLNFFPPPGRRGRAEQASHLRAYFGRWQQRNPYRGLRHAACSTAAGGTGLHS